MHESVERSDGSKSARVAAGIVDEETTLLEIVRTSCLSIAVYEISPPRLLAVSQRAREQLGFEGVDVASVDIVESSGDPESARKILSLISSGKLKEWRFLSWLRSPGAGGFWAMATGRAVDLGARRLGLVAYPTSVDESSDGAKTHMHTTRSLDAHGRIDHVRGDIEALFAFQFDDPVGDGFIRVVDPAEADDVLARATAESAATISAEVGPDRVAELEGHLRRIAREIEAARVPTGVAATLIADVPGVADLSMRQREIVTRLLRGERVPTIARGLYLSASTVRNHLSTIYRKVGVNSQIELLELLQKSNTSRTQRGSGDHGRNVTKPPYEPT
jgi:DNA-binding CsgD family transcriptional regulator